MTHFDATPRNCVSECCPVATYCYININSPRFINIAQIFSDIWQLQKEDCDQFKSVLGHLRYVAKIKSGLEDYKYPFAYHKPYNPDDDYSAEDYKMQSGILTMYAKMAINPKIQCIY